MKKSLFLLMMLSTTVLNAQDVIVKTDGSTIICKVIEVGTSEVKYKKYSNLDGPLYTITSENIQNINFENGEKEIINDSELTDSKTSSKNGPVLNYGTEFPIQIESPVKARDVSEGDYISFKSMIDIDVDGVKVIRAGTPVKGIVYKAKRSSWWGTKGKLGIKLDHLLLPDGTQIPVNGDIYVTGKNRTALTVLLFLFVTWPACFICGSKAEIPYGFTAMAKIGAPVQFPKNGKPIIMSNAYNEPKVATPIKLSSLKDIPPLPCNANLVLMDGSELKRQIVEIDTDNGIVRYLKLNENWEVDNSDDYLYYIEEKELMKIDFVK